LTAKSPAELAYEESIRRVEEGEKAADVAREGLESTRFLRQDPNIPANFPALGAPTEAGQEALGVGADGQPVGSPLPPTPGTDQVGTGGGVEIPEADLPEVPSALIGPNDDVTEVRRRYANIKAVPPDDRDLVINLAVHLRAQGDDDAMNEFIAKIDSQPKAPRAQERVDAAIAIARQLPLGTKRDAADAIRAVIATQEESFGPNGGSFTVPLTRDPNTGRVAVDLVTAERDLQNEWFSALAREAGYASFDMLPPNTRTELRRQAEEKARADLWKVAANAQGVPLLEDRGKLERDLQDEWLPYAVLRSTLSKHTTSSAFTPTAHEMAQENAQTAVARVATTGLLDLVAPWERQLRIQLGGAVTGEDRNVAAALSASTFAGMDPGYQDFRNRVVHDYLENQVAYDESRRVYGTIHGSVAEAFGASPEEAARIANDSAESWQAYVVGFVPEMFNVSLVDLATAGLSKGIRVGQRALAVRNLYKTSEHLIEAAARPEDLAKVLTTLEKEDFTSAKILEARINEATAEEVGKTFSPSHYQHIVGNVADAERELEEQSGLLGKSLGRKSDDSSILDFDSVTDLKASGVEQAIPKVSEEAGRALVVEAQLSAKEAQLNAARELNKKHTAQTVKRAASAKKIAEANQAVQDLAHANPRVADAFQADVARTAIRSEIRARAVEQASLEQALGKVPDSTKSAVQTQIDAHKRMTKQLRGDLKTWEDKYKIAIDSAGEDAGKLYADRMRQWKSAMTTNERLARELGYAPAAVDPALVTRLTAEVESLDNMAKMHSIRAHSMARRLVIVDAKWVATHLDEMDPHVAALFSAGGKGPLRKMAQAAKKAAEGKALGIAADQMKRLAADLVAGATEITKRTIPPMFLGIPFAGIKKGLPPDEFSRVTPIAQKLVKHDGGKFLLDPEKYKAALLTEYGEGVFAESLASAIEHQGAAEAREAILTVDEEGKRLARQLKGVVGAREAEPASFIFLRAVNPPTSGTTVELTGSQLDQLTSFERSFGVTARRLRANEDQFRLVMVVLQGNHDIPYGGARGSVRILSNARRLVENWWKQFGNIGGRIGNVAEKMRDTLRYTENLSDRYQDELIEVANRAARSGKNPIDAMTAYIDRVAPVKLNNGSSILNSLGSKTIWERGKRAILSDPRTATGLGEGVTVGTSEQALSAGGNFNLPLLGLARMWIRGATDAQSKILYARAYDLLSKSGSWQEFSGKMRAATIGVVGRGFEGIDQRSVHAYALGARAMAHAAMFDDLAYITGRELFGVLDEKTANAINHFLGVGSGLRDARDVARAVNAMVELGISPGQSVVRQASRSAAARLAGGAMTDTLRMVEAGTVLTGKASYESIFLPSVVRREVDRKLGGIIKELDTYYAAAPNATAEKIHRGYQWMIRLWKTEATTGLLLPQPKYFLWNFWGDWTQMAVEIGFIPATTVQISNVWALIPGIGRPIQDLIGRTVGKAVGGKPGLPGVIESFLNPAVGRLWSGADDEVIRLGQNTTMLGTLRRQMIETGVADTFISEELQDALRNTMRSVRDRYRLTSPQMYADLLANWQSHINEFGVALQQRQRSAMWMHLMSRGETPEEAAKHVRNALYDWGHGVAKDELWGIGNNFAFYRFMRLYLGQVSDAMLESITRPDLVKMSDILMGRTKFSRLRRQAVFLRDGVPGLWNSIRSDDSASDEQAARRQFAEAMRPIWSRQWPAAGMGPIDPKTVDYMWKFYGDKTPTAKYTILPPALAVDGLELALTPIKVMTLLGLRALGEDQVADVWRGQLLDPIGGMLSPHYREMYKSIIDKMTGEGGSGGKGEWRIRPEEYKVMSSLPFIKEFTRKGEGLGEFYATQSAIVATRMFPLVIGRLSQLVKYWKYQNPDSAESMSAGLLYFARQFAGIGREYYFDPATELVNREKQINRGIKSAVDRARARAVPGAEDLPDYYNLKP